MAELIVATQKKTTLLPEAVNELYQGVNALCRTFRKTAEGVEATVDGGIEITSLLLKQQRERLLNEYA